MFYIVTFTTTIDNIQHVCNSFYDDKIALAEIIKERLFEMQNKGEIAYHGNLSVVADFIIEHQEVIILNDFHTLLVKSYEGVLNPYTIPIKCESFIKYEDIVKKYYEFEIFSELNIEVGDLTHEQFDVLDDVKQPVVKAEKFDVCDDYNDYIFENSEVSSTPSADEFIQKNTTQTQSSEKQFEDDFKKYHEEVYDYLVA